MLRFNMTIPNLVIPGAKTEESAFASNKKQIPHCVRNDTLF